MTEKLIFEKSRTGRKGYSLPSLDIPVKENILPANLLTEKEPEIVELSERDVVQHFVRLARKNFCVDANFYPLGSCTMKYSPKINEKIAANEKFANLHPYQPEKLSQGILKVLYEMERSLSEICAMARFSLQPTAGAHGELTGNLIIKAYHQQQGNPRKIILVPDSSHGTNPSSANSVGYNIVTVKSNSFGEIDLEDLTSKTNEEVAALMLTLPNTLGLFERKILEIAEILHRYGALLYMDGANMNALLGIVKPGEMGVDILHLNLHKTFSTPHGGGGPGSGPIGVTEKLVPFLPVPLIGKQQGKYFLNYDLPNSIGKVAGFYGNVGVILKAYAYIKALGGEGLKKVAENAVLNANYLRVLLKNHYLLPYDRICMHEFVLAAVKQKEKLGGARAAELIGKRLLDFGFHAPTIYFPLIVHEALMIEPTETESKEVLDEFAQALIKIDKEIEENPDLVKDAPHTTEVLRLDQAGADRNPILRYRNQGD